MLNELTKYTNNNYFHFKVSDRLSNVCNAPTDKSGIYLVYDINNNCELIYIGLSGKKNEDGSIIIRRSKLGGIKDRIVNGHQFGKDARKRTWPKQMREENIEILKVHWFITHNENYIDCPKSIETNLLKLFFTKYGRLPRWNKVF